MQSLIQFGVWRLRGGMLITIRYRGGDNELEVDRNDSIADVKSKIRACTGIHPDQQRLCYAYRELGEHHTWEDYDIQFDSTLRLLLREHGDMQIWVNTLDDQR